MYYEEKAIPKTNDIKADGTELGMLEIKKTYQSSAKTKHIPWRLLSRGLNGVAIATKAKDDEIAKTIGELTPILHEVIEREKGSQFTAFEALSLSLHDWHCRIDSLKLNDSSRHRIRIALGLAFLCHCSRNNQEVSHAELDFVWNLIREALECTLVEYTVSRSAQGFLSVPLWSIVEGGNIEELFRFHVWLPDGKRGVADLSIHSHQPFARSWILAGEGHDHTYGVEPADAIDATHAEFGLTWTGSTEEKGSSNYKVHQISSTITNRGKFVRAILQTSNKHNRYSSYAIPAGAFHRSEITEDALHSTLFLFDSSQGFQKLAPVLGPVSRESYTQKRDAGNVSAQTLCTMVEAVRKWEVLFDEGLRKVTEDKLGKALEAFQNALQLCSIHPDILSHARYHDANLDQITRVYRMMGRDDLADTLLK